MKHHEWRYSIKAGLQGLIRHPLLTVAAVSTLALMLFLMSGFVAISMNANHLSRIAAQQPPIEISMRVGADVDQVTELAEFLANNAMVQEYEIFTPQMNFQQFMEDMGKDDLWKDFDYSLSIPYTFSLRLTDPAYGESFESEVMEFQGVKEVLMESQLMSLLNSIKGWTRRVGIVLFIILALTAAVVMANTVRIAVLSRGREINIMRYVGSTNAFIRTPFIVEGAVIGVVGALLASLAAALIYGRLVVRLNPTSGDSAASFYLLPAASVSGNLLALNLGIGILLCVVVSALSVRKYARV